jgi:hypothetical protein
MTMLAEIFMLRLETLRAWTASIPPETSSDARFVPIKELTTPATEVPPSEAQSQPPQH